MNIGKLPIKEKQNLIKLAVELIEHPNKNYRLLKKQILKLLKEKPLTIRELALQIRARQMFVWKYIKQLEKMDKVKTIGKLKKQGGANIWSFKY